MASGEQTRGPSTPAEAAEWLNKRFRPDAARDVRVLYAFDLGEEGVIGVQIDAGRLRVQLGGVSEPDVVMRLAARDLYDVLAGRGNPDLLFMEERIEVDGDLSLALRLRTFFANSA